MAGAGGAGPEAIRLAKAAGCLLAIAVIAGGLLFASAGAGQARELAVAPRTLASRGTQTLASRSPRTLAGPSPSPRPWPVGITRVAWVRRPVAGYAAPGRRRVASVPASWDGYPSVLPVLALAPGWVRVRLAQRPDGSTAWIPAADVTLGSTPYAIVIDLKAMRLTLYDRGRAVFAAPAGVGAPADPTPLGHFFAAFTEAPPAPGAGYGPFVIVTSAHSRVIKDWAGSGDAVMGIHGPLGADRAIGTSGARISHGCIRLHLSALGRLRMIPPGTPVTVIAG